MKSDASSQDRAEDLRLRLAPVCPRRAVDPVLVQFVRAPQDSGSRMLDQVGDAASVGLPSGHGLRASSENAAKRLVPGPTLNECEVTEDYEGASAVAGGAMYVGLMSFGEQGGEAADRSGQPPTLVWNVEVPHRVP